MTRKQKRLSIIAGLGVVLALAVTLILVALRDQIVFFYSPTEIHEKAVAAGTPIRLGGLVKEGSWVKTGEVNEFIVTDGASELTASYSGILPDLFTEGQGVVVEGTMTDAGSFAATNVLAKHDENYMPKEVVEALKANGEWQREGAGG
ncbi:MAG: cytochrome c maturation protein CcmE [Hyphomicrobiales bacterium]|nr:MAG: cytochrome c maturation protein CcmE [Hyphomicrobiales bacterium]